MKILELPPPPPSDTCSRSPVVLSGVGIRWDESAQGYRVGFELNGRMVERFISVLETGGADPGRLIEDALRDALDELGEPDLIDVEFYIERAP
jgi:hypothetical protein